MIDNSNIDERTKRNIVQRVLTRVVWFVIIYQVVVMVVGGIVGLTADTLEGGLNAGYSAGKEVSEEFFEEHAISIFIGAVAFAYLMVWKGNLPGTGKYKGVKGEGGSRSPSTYRSLPRWLREAVRIVAMIIAAGVWGFLASAMGAHDIVIAMGVVVITSGVFMLFRDGKGNGLG